MKHATLAAVVLFVTLPGVAAADWPTYRADAARTGYTAEALPAKLSVRWVHHASHAPRPAWPTSDRQLFDHAYQPVVKAGTLYYGSSADCRVHAVDTATGETRWTFFTDAPIRFAPALWNDRLFVVSDDGHLYALRASDGAVLWKVRPGPSDRMILGNQRMVSPWSARGGPAVVDDIVYFGAGIWPSEGVFLYAVDAATGKVIWRNTQAGEMEMGQPHGGATAKSGVAAQGYLAIANDHLYLPTGRAVPAAFDTTNGELRYFHLQRYTHYGGALVAVIDDHFYNSDCAFDLAEGKMIIRRLLPTAAIAAAPEHIVVADDKYIAALDRREPYLEQETKQDNNEKGDKKPDVKKKKVIIPNLAWRIEAPGAGGTALIVAGDTAISAAPDQVTGVDLTSQRIVWSHQVKGNPHGLAVDDGQLFVSTDQGLIYCFDASGTASPTHIRPIPDPDPYPNNELYAKAAEEIIRKTGITEGYCLDLGCGDGRLAYELARRTRLQIYAIDPYVRNVVIARQKLNAAGLYGTSVMVHTAAQRSVAPHSQSSAPQQSATVGDLSKTPYPNYFADLIISGRSVTTGPNVVPAEEMLRLQRPYGGVVCLGKPGEMKMNVRGALAGAGAWTHQYCDPANTLASTDTAIGGPLSILWYDRPDLNTPNRHGRSPAPLFHDGRLYVEGLDAIRALDAYNGRVLWQFYINGIGRPYHGEHLMGASGTGSNFCVAGDSVYARTEDHCLRINGPTGKQLGKFTAPLRSDGKKGTWGFVAGVDGVLFGSLVNEDHRQTTRFGMADMSRLFTESLLFFALDAETGKLKWTFEPEHSIRHNTIAIGGGRVYLIDRPLADEASRGKKGGAPQPNGKLLAFDAESGDVDWTADEEIYGTMLALSVKHDVLLMSYQATRFRLSSEIGGSMSAFDATDGKRLWDRKIDYRSRPLILDDTIIAEPGAWSLTTGEPKRVADPDTKEEKLWQFSRSYGCGVIAACKNLLLFRSATLGYIDLATGTETTNYGGLRPGCWINAIPAGGLVLMPDTTSVCRCSYLNKATIALQPAVE
jgi:outer membrane protein assembly factor BamB